MYDLCGGRDTKFFEFEMGVSGPNQLASFFLRDRRRKEGKLPEGISRKRRETNWHLQHAMGGAEKEVNRRRQRSREVERGMMGEESERRMAQDDKQRIDLVEKRTGQGRKEKHKEGEK